MRKILIAAVIAAACAFAGTAGAALVPGVYDPDKTGCPVAKAQGGWLHLEKNCATTTNASAGADITGLTGQTFTSASFTLKSTTQCQGGSPRFNIVTTTGTFFLGCNNVTPVTNANGTVTYTFDAASIAAGGGQVPFPTGTITAVDVLIDVQGSADLSNITFNGVVQVPVVASGPPTTKADCKHGGWKSFTNPSFKNQGQCVAYVNHHSSHGKSHKDHKGHKSHKAHKLEHKGEQHSATSHKTKHGK
jgi:hypothetical protein